MLRSATTARLVDGGDFTTRWSIAVPAFALVGKRGLVLDGKTFRAIDVGSGKETKRFKLSAEASSTCVEGGALVVRQRDGVAWVYDTATDTRSDGMPKETCRPPDRPQPCVNARADCSLVNRGDLRLAAGRKEAQIVFADIPPRAVSIIGFDDRGKEHYRRVVDAEGRRVKDVDLVGDELLVFQDGVQAFDVVSGEALWQRAGGARMRAGSTRAYVSAVRDGVPMIEVIGLKDGVLVKSLPW